MHNSVPSKLFCRIDVYLRIINENSLFGNQIKALCKQIIDSMVGLYDLIPVA